MPASYPAGTRPFDTKVDFTQVIIADHINSLQEEIVAIENTLGNPLPSSGWIGTLDKVTTTWGSLAARLANIEYGISGDSHTQYLRSTGGETIQPSNSTVVGLNIQGFTNQTADLLRVKNSAGTVLTKIDKDGKVLINNQEIKPIIMGTTQPDGTALGLPTGTLWIDSDSTPPVLAADTTLQITGGTLLGDQALTSRLRNITVSLADPTGGNNGDIWIKYTA